MTQGKIVEYLDQGRFVCTVCLHDKGNKLHLLTPLNREVNLAPKRAVLISGPTMNISGPREDLLDRLRKTEALRVTLKDQVNVKELWELVREEKEDFDHAYLAQLAFEDEVTDDHLSALIRALFESRLYFKMKDGHFHANSEEIILKILKKKEEEALRAEKLGQGSAWLKEIQQGKAAEEPPCKGDIIDVLMQLALYGNDAPDYKTGKDLLALAGISRIEEARKLLVKMGIWKEDENLDLLKLDIRTSFTDPQLEESARLAGREPVREAFEDLRDLPILTIDGPFTRDFDDAISLQVLDDGFHLGIHIADVAGTILPDSILDQTAAERASSLYLPRRQIPMMPLRLSQDVLSLKKSCDRRAISLLARLDTTGDLLDYRFLPSLIRVQRQLVYGEVNEVLEEDPLLKDMVRLSERLRRKRMDQGALSLSLPELEIRFNPDSSFSLELVPQDTPSRRIIAEFMILYNWLTAAFCKENRIPVLYRAQAKPSERISLDETGYLYYVMRQRRKLSPLYIHTTPRPHSGLGLEMYTHATSPIRRYLDLVTQRQVRHFLLGKGIFFDEETLDEIRMKTEPTIRNLGFIKRNRLRYWTLKFLSKHRGEKYEALVLDELKHKYRIVLKDFLLIADIKQQNGVILHPGQVIWVEMKRADPWEDLVELQYIPDS